MRKLITLVCLLGLAACDVFPPDLDRKNATPCSVWRYAHPDHGKQFDWFMAYLRATAKEKGAEWVGRVNEVTLTDSLNEYCRQVPDGNTAEGAILVVDMHVRGAAGK